jgi:hypothetical protein
VQQDDYSRPLFFNETHGGSSRPVAYLKGARLERSMDAAGEEEYSDYISSIRGKQMPRMQFEIQLHVFMSRFKCHLYRPCRKFVAAAHERTLLDVTRKDAESCNVEP